MNAQLQGYVIEGEGLGGTLTTDEKLHGEIGFGMERIISGKAVQVKNRHELLNLGDSDAVYFITDENAVYRWDEENLKYYCCGRDYNGIELITGGNANG